MLRLLKGTGLVSNDVEASRLSRVEKARLLACRTQSVVILKGPGTVIADPEGRTAVNLSGSQELATAGSGDLLTGITASVLAHGYAPFDAACAAVYLHGFLGELDAPVPWRVHAGLIADDFLDRIGPALDFLRTHG